MDTYSTLPKSNRLTAPRVNRDYEHDTRGAAPFGATESCPSLGEVPGRAESVGCVSP